MLKRADIILCVMLIILGVSLYLFLPFGAGEIVTIKHGGITVYSASLHEDHVLTIEGEYTNEIRIEDSMVYYHSSDCPGQDCIKMGRVRTAGATIACAPNSTIVIIDGQSEVDGIAE